jgi:hypothetical protein
MTAKVVVVNDGLVKVTVLVKAVEVGHDYRRDSSYCLEQNLEK